MTSSAGVSSQHPVPVRRGEPGSVTRGSAASSATVASATAANSGVIVPPLNLRGGASSGNNSTNTGGGQSSSSAAASWAAREAVGSPVKGVSTTLGPGGRSPQPVSSLQREFESRSTSQSSPDRPALHQHPYWKTSSPDGRRSAANAGDVTAVSLRPAEPPASAHASKVPRAPHAPDDGEDCPTPNLQHSARVEPTQPLEHLPKPQTPPPRPTMPRATT